MVRRVSSWVVCLIAAGACAACAKGSAIETESSGSTGGAGSGGAASSTTQTVTTGPTCVQDPCKLVDPQCGCDAGSQCTIDGAGDRVCVGAGTVSIGQPCDDTATCGPGGICVGYTGVQTTCAAFCDVDAQCEPPGGLCVLTLGDGAGGTIPGVLLCSENCDLATSLGCSVAGTGCQLGLTDADEAFTLCGPSGTGVYQSLCTDTSECAPGYACLPTTNNDNRCFQWCHVSSPGCLDAGLTCTGLEITAGVPLTIGAEPFGVCSP